MSKGKSLDLSLPWGGVQKRNPGWESAFFWEFWFGGKGHRRETTNFEAPKEEEEEEEEERNASPGKSKARLRQVGRVGLAIYA